MFSDPLGTDLPMRLRGVMPHPRALRPADQEPPGEAARWYHPAMNRPFVLMNAAVSIDSKLAPFSRRKVRLGSERDRARMDRLRASSDAILIGAGTLRSEDPPLQVKSPALRRSRERRGLPQEILEIVLSGSLDLPFEGRFFREGAAPRLLVVPESAPPGRLGRARKQCEVLVLGRRKIDLRRLLARLDRWGIGRLLVEGGGATFAPFLSEDLVDEIHLTVCPVLVGGAGAPTLFEGRGFDGPSFPPMALDLCRREGEEVYLRYRRRR